MLTANIRHISNLNRTSPQFCFCVRISSQSHIVTRDWLDWLTLLSLLQSESRSGSTRPITGGTRSKNSVYAPMTASSMQELPQVSALHRQSNPMGNTHDDRPRALHVCCPATSVVQLTIRMQLGRTQKPWCSELDRCPFSTSTLSLGLTRVASYPIAEEFYSLQDYGFVGGVAFGRAVPRTGQRVHVSLLWHGALYRVNHGSEGAAR